MKRAALAIGLCVAGCGVEFDPQDEITSLRVLGVQKDKPYARPGDTVNISMLWHDGFAERPASTEVQTAWLAGCFNPPGNRYFGCFTQFAANGQGETGAEPADAQLQRGDTFSLEVPPNVLASAGDPPGGGARQGTAFVFFAACAGQLAFADPQSSQFGFPLRCRDDLGNELGSEDFVAGYATVFIYEELTHQNPRIAELEFDGETRVADCTGESCVGFGALGLTCEDPAAVCLPRCQQDNEEDCPAMAFRPIVDPASVELDPLASVDESRALYEQMWINYYADRGSLTSGVKLLSEPTLGIRGDYATELRVPNSAGPLQLWAVVHDNRGGVDWARLTVIVQ